MSGKEKTRFVSRFRTAYKQSSSKKEKSAIVDALIQCVGYKSRKHVITILSKDKNSTKSSRKGRNKILNEKQVDFLRKLWRIMGYPCAKRMLPVLPEWCEALKKLPKSQQEITFVELPKFSAATLDRVLSKFRVANTHKKSISTDLQHLKQNIPFVCRNDSSLTPGCFSADTVAHCGGNLKGSFVWSLTVTDELTLWTHNRAIWNKGQYATCNALLHILRQMPMRIRSINSDNGSEFINYHLQNLIKQHYKTIRLTRSRPYKKNDNARVEERNRRLVREMLGDVRLDNERFVYLLNQMHKWLNLLHNHFISSMRITSKERYKGKIHKTYDIPKTPYQRVLHYMPEGRRKERFIQYHNSLNPCKINTQITLYRNKIIKLLSRLEQ